MPSIDVDTEVYEALKARAVPFEDTPNSVLRRALDLDAGVAPNTVREGVRPGSRAEIGSLLPEREYERPILQALVEAGGSASAKTVTDRVGELLGSKLTAADRDLNRSGEVRWRNRAAFTRLRLVERGLLLGNSRRGIWEISQAGREVL